MSNIPMIEVAAGLWTVSGSQKLLGIELGGRMTVIRLSSGDLILHSPVAITHEIRSSLNEIGVVKYIVAPNKFHHLHIGSYITCYPEALLYAARGLSEKRQDIDIHGVLPDDAPSEWNGEVELLLVEGIPVFNEVVFYHPGSKSVVFTDLIFNYRDDLSLGTKIFAWLDGVYGKPGVSLLIRKFMIRDREKLRNSVNEILLWDFDRVLVPHKDIIESGGKAHVENAFEVFRGA